MSSGLPSIDTHGRLELFVSHLLSDFGSLISVLDMKIPVINAYLDSFWYTLSIAISKKCSCLDLPFNMAVKRVILKSNQNTWCIVSAKDEIYCKASWWISPWFPLRNEWFSFEHEWIVLERVQQSFNLKSYSGNTTGIIIKILTQKPLKQDTFCVAFFSAFRTLFPLPSEIIILRTVEKNNLKISH